MRKIILVCLAILTLILSASPAMAAKPEKAMIIYFDYSENIDPEGIDIDAISAQTDKNENRQFTFAEPLPELEDVDTVYFLSPIWWYTMPQPVRSFFQQVDLSGKQLAYFSINRGSNNGNILNELAEYQPNTEIIAQYSLNAMIDNESAEKEFTDYLDTQNWLSK